MSPLLDSRVGYAPILDVARGIAAGYQAIALTTGQAVSDYREQSLSLIRTALAAFSTLPDDTFMTVPVPLGLANDEHVRRLLESHGDLAGIILDITNFSPEVARTIGTSIDDYRSRGAKISVGGHRSSQPELGSIVRLRPSIIRLGRDWVSGLDRSAAKRTAIEVTGRLAAQLDAWILVESVESSPELRALSELNVPLAQGPFIGDVCTSWPNIAPLARTVLPPQSARTQGTLRELVQQTYTTREQSAAQRVLPESSGFESVIVIDNDNRPVTLLERGPLGQWESADILKVNIDTPATEAATRAMARPRSLRFLPLVCTDTAGRFLGLITIERLIDHLAFRVSS